MTHYPIIHSTLKGENQLPRKVNQFVDQRHDLCTKAEELIK